MKQVTFLHVFQHVVTSLQPSTWVPKNAHFLPPKITVTWTPQKGEGVDVNFPFQRAVFWGSMFIFAGVIFETFHRALLGCNPPSLTDWSSAPPFLQPLSWKKTSESSPKKGLISGKPIHPSFSKGAVEGVPIFFLLFFLVRGLGSWDWKKKTNTRIQKSKDPKVQPVPKESTFTDPGFATQSHGGIYSMVYPPVN